MVSKLIRASVSGRSSVVVKDESSTLKLFVRSSLDSQVICCNASYQQRNVKNSM